MITYGPQIYRAKKRKREAGSLPGSITLLFQAGGYPMAARATALFSCVRYRHDRYVLTVVALLAELDFTFNLGKKRVVFAHADVRARIPFGAALTDDDVTRNDVFATELFHAKAFAF